MHTDHTPHADTLEDTGALCSMRALMAAMVGTLAHAGAPVAQSRRTSAASLSRMSETELKLFMFRASGDELDAAEVEYMRRLENAPRLI